MSQPTYMRISNDRISLEYLHQCLRLDVESGHLYWLRRPPEHFAARGAFTLFEGKYAGRRADADRYRQNGYARVRISVNRAKYGVSAHRIAFALANGRWPDMVVDHIDGDRTNNRPGNLREVTQGENLRLGAIRRAGLNS
jgi:hypothetical protein